MVFVSNGEGTTLEEKRYITSYKHFCVYSTLLVHLPPFAEIASLKIYSLYSR